MIRPFALFALLSVGVATPALAQRATLPVRMVELPNGDRRFTTTLVIDGKPVEVGIDTGSTGLRVLPRSLAAGSLGKRGPRITYSYGAGTGFDGEAIVVSVGAGALTGSVKVMRITGVGCVSGRPDCPVAHLDLATYGIQGDGLPNQGFAAILGIRLKADPVANPFEQLGIKRWIVELPRDPSQEGRIVLDPDAADLATYARIDVDADGTTPGCLVGPQKLCGRAFFDSGAAGLRVLQAAAFRPWPNGTPATIEVGSAAQRQAMTVTIGRRDEASALLHEPGGSNTRLSLGFAPYFHWSVLYDAERHQIGVKPR